MIGRPPVLGREELGRSERGRSLLFLESGRSERGRSLLFLESGRDVERPELELEGGRELLERLGGLSTIESPHPCNS